MCRVETKSVKLFVVLVLLLPLPSSMWSPSLPGMTHYCYMLLEGQKVSLGVHPDAVLTQDYSLPDGTAVHVIVGEEEQDKLFALQGILDEEE